MLIAVIVEEAIFELATLFAELTDVKNSVCDGKMLGKELLDVIWKDEEESAKNFKRFYTILNSTVTLDDMRQNSIHLFH